MSWRDLPERSNRFWILLFIRLIKVMGRPFARILLYPITLHFLLFNNRARSSSKAYLKSVLGRPPRFRDFYSQYFTFACVLMDRIAVLTQPNPPIHIDFKGFEHLEAVHRGPRGAVLVGSHLGSIDILRTSTLRLRGYAVRAIMYGKATPTLLGVLISLNPELHEELILVPGPSALINLVSDIESGSMIGILGDRVMPSERTIACDFLGQTTNFPLTPALISEILDVPLIQCFCIHKAWGHYEVIFETLSQGASGERSKRKERIESTTRQYVRNLESQTRKSPYNWFNFYDYWAPEDSH